MSAIARRGVCLVLSAPSGAGKTSIADALLASEPELRRSVSVTTRAPRAGETDGVHYHFHNQAAFDRMVAAGELLEWARVLGRHCYGTPRAPVEQSLRDGKDVVFDIDWQGHRQLRAALPDDVVGVFILPPTLAVLERRLHHRSGDDAAEIARRMALARDEISHWAEFTHVVVNDELQRATVAVRAVLHAARVATQRQVGLHEFVASLSLRGA
jgi:guanylate kinase